MNKKENRSLDYTNMINCSQTRGILMESKGYEQTTPQITDRVNVKSTRETTEKDTKEKIYF